MGQGLIIADWFLTLLVTLCALAHIAIIRAPDISESKLIEHVRYIKVGGFLILSLRYWFIMCSEGDLLVPMPTEMGQTLIFSAELLRTVYRLFQHKMDRQYETRASKKEGKQ